MVEEDRATEAGKVYVWYKCVKVGCGGQWLSQLSAAWGASLMTGLTIAAR